MGKTRKINGPHFTEEEMDAPLTDAEFEESMFYTVVRVSSRAMQEQARQLQEAKFTKHLEEIKMDFEQLTAGNLTDSDGHIVQLLSSGLREIEKNFFELLQGIYLIRVHDDYQAHRKAREHLKSKWKLFSQSKRGSAAPKMVMKVRFAYFWSIDSVRVSFKSRYPGQEGTDRYWAFLHNRIFKDSVLEEIRSGKPPVKMTYKEFEDSKRRVLNESINKKAR